MAFSKCHATTLVFCYSNFYYFMCNLYSFYRKGGVSRVRGVGAYSLTRVSFHCAEYKEGVKFWHKQFINKLL